MKIGVLGTGVTGQTIGIKLVQLGHDVMMGSRDEANPNAIAWAKDLGHNALYGTFMNAAEFGEIIFNCTLGSASLAALKQAEPPRGSPATRASRRCRRSPFSPSRSGHSG